MKTTHGLFAVASFALVAVTGALAAPPNAAGENTRLSVRPLTTDAVVSDLVKFRQSGPTTQQPRDGEWYNVPAPLGYRARTGGHESASFTQSMSDMQRTDETASPQR